MTADAPSPDTLRTEWPPWALPLMRPARYKSASGGRGSGKSEFFGRFAVLRMANLVPDYPPGPVRIASARDYEVNLDESVKIVVENAIREYGLSDEFDVKVQWIDHANGSHMFFPGVSRKVESFLSMADVDVFGWSRPRHCKRR